jgi:tight adherence protein B
MSPLAALLFGLCVGTTLVLLVLAFSGPSANKAVDRRLMELRERVSDSGAVAVQAKMRRALTQQNTRMDTLASQLIPNPALLRRRIAQTGKDWTLTHYVLASLGTFLVVAALLRLRGFPTVLALMLGLFAGLGLPHFVVGRMITRRVNQFTARFPDAIELLVRGLRSGLPIGETLGVVGQEVPGPVGVEFRAVSDKMKIGRTMDVALQETADRLGTPEFQFFVITLAIQRETGGNLAETLSNLADVLRKRAQMKLKIRAMSSESKASAYIVGVLPFFVFAAIWFVNNDYMLKFFTDERLMVAGIGGLIWMGIGAFIMAKMVSFEI